MIISAYNGRFCLYFKNSWTFFKNNSRAIIFIIIISTLISALIIYILIFYFIIFFSFSTILISRTLFFLFQTNILNNSIYLLYCWLWFRVTCIKWFGRLSVCVYWLSIELFFFFLMKWSYNFFRACGRCLDFEHGRWAYLRRLNTAFIWKSYMMFYISNILLLQGIFLSMI